MPAYIPRIAVDLVPRGNQSGYISSDYARDAAAAINKQIGDQGLYAENGREKGLIEADLTAELDKVAIGRELLSIAWDEAPAD